MPTIQKPQLTEAPLRYFLDLPLADYLEQNRDQILASIGFYKERGRVGDFAGRFDEEIEAAADEVLSTISNILFKAALIGKELSTGVLLSTLRRLRRDPSLLEQVPEAVRFAVARRWQRESEKPGTFWADVYGVAPKDYPAEVIQPDKSRLQRAIQCAIDAIRPARGRPPHEAQSYLSHDLGALFQSYYGKIGRKSVKNVVGDATQQHEEGPFRLFLQCVLTPLNVFQRTHKLPPFSPDVIVREAANRANNQDTLLFP